MAHKSSGNLMHFPNEALIKQEAAEWIVKLDQGALTEKQTRELKEWCGRSARHLAQLELLAKSWDQMTVLEELAELFPLHNSDDDKVEVDSGRGAWWREYWQLGVASAVACVCFSIFLVLQMLPETYSTKIGEQRQEYLSDGSRILLNTNSRVLVDYNKGGREIHLLKGEAHFDVAKDPQRPFVVHAGEGVIWAIGTEFNVRFNQEAVGVIVTEGTVKVFAGKLPSSSTANTKTSSVKESMAVASEAKKEKVPDSTRSTEVTVGSGTEVVFEQYIHSQKSINLSDMKKKLAWHNGSIVFDNEPLAEVLAEISRYTDKVFLIHDAETQQMPIGGHFKLDDIEGLLVTLSHAFDLNVESDKGNKVFVSKKNNRT